MMFTNHPFNYFQLLVTLLSGLPQANGNPTTTSYAPSCRYLPADAGWPNNAAWSKLNQTVGGKLIKGVPYGQPCFGPTPDVAACATVRQRWEDLDPFLADPVNVVSSYFENYGCDPFNPLPSNSSAGPAQCSLGYLAYYAINVTDAASAVAGVNFARKNNIRLTIKNTGHDLLGRSSGQGSLALWTHHLKDTKFFQYRSKYYTGPAMRLGAGVQVEELYRAADAKGYRVTGGGSLTVGAAGGWLQGGGHGPLAALYGLGADNALEFEVVTADGQYLTVSRSQNADLFWALSGGGPSNFAVVLSATLKAHKDGPVASSTLFFAEANSTKYWMAVEAWERHLLVLDTIPGFQSVVTLGAGFFSLGHTTLPDATAADVDRALAPFYTTLNQLNITFTKDSITSTNFPQHYLHYEASAVYNRAVGDGEGHE